MSIFQFGLDTEWFALQHKGSVWNGNKVIRLFMDMNESAGK